VVTMVADDFPGGVLGWMFIDGGDLRHNDIAGSGRGRGYAVVATDVVAGLGNLRGRRLGMPLVARYGLDEAGEAPGKGLSIEF